MLDDTAGIAPDDGGVATIPIHEPILDQREIDVLAGYQPDGPVRSAGGARAMVGAAAAGREPLPMFRIALDDWATRLSGRLRGLVGGEAEVTLSRCESCRFGDFIDDVVLPSLGATFRAEGWDGSGLVSLGPGPAVLLVDTLLGAGRRAAPSGIGARPFSAIETALLGRIVDLVLEEGERAFAPVAPVAFRRDRMETDPRLLAVARPEDHAHVATFSVTLGGRTAPLQVVLPAAVLEPVRHQLGGTFLGVKLGRDDRWSSHLAGEVWRSEIEAEAILHELRMPLRELLALSVGDTITFDLKPTDLIEVRSGGVTITRGRVGRSEGRIAVQIAEPVASRLPGGTIRA